MNPLMQVVIRANMFSPWLSLRVVMTIESFGDSDAMDTILHGTRYEHESWTAGCRLWHWHSGAGKRRQYRPTKLTITRRPSDQVFASAGASVPENCERSGTRTRLVTPLTRALQNSGPKHP